MSSNSLVQKIWNSHVYSAWLQEEVQAEHEGARDANLSAAKHRFCSFSKPLGRCCRHLAAILRVVHRIISFKGREDAAFAKQWLANLSSEKLILLSLLADAADEGIQITRVMDSEDLDLSEIMTEVSDFISRVEVLFNKRQALNLTGYTNHIITLLKSKQLIVFCNGAAKQLSFQESDVETPLQRMQEWVPVAKKICEAEFPKFHLFAAFEIFTLTETTARWRPPPNDGDVDRHAGHLERLGRAFKGKCGLAPS